MNRLPPLTGERVLTVLRALGYVMVSQRGSHVKLRHPDGRTTIVPLHRGEEIGPGLLRKIINDAQLTREEFLRVLRGS